MLSDLLKAMDVEEFNEEETYEQRMEARLSEKYQNRKKSVTMEPDMELMGRLTLEQARKYLQLIEKVNIQREIIEGQDEAITFLQGQLDQSKDSVQTEERPYANQTIGKKLLEEVEMLDWVKPESEEDINAHIAEIEEFISHLKAEERESKSVCRLRIRKAKGKIGKRALRFFLEQEHGFSKEEATAALDGLKEKMPIILDFADESKCEDALEFFKYYGVKVKRIR